MKNVKKTYGEPKVISVTLAATKAAGDLVVVGELIACLVTGGGSGDIVSAYIGGVEIEYTKLTADDVTSGAILYFDAGNNRLTLTASTHKKAGVAAAAAGTSATSCRLLLGEIR